MKKTVENPGQLSHQAISDRVIKESTYKQNNVSPILSRTIAQTPANESQIRGYPIHQGTADMLMQDEPTDFIQALKAGLLVVV